MNNPINYLIDCVFTLNNIKMYIEAYAKVKDCTVSLRDNKMLYVQCDKGSVYFDITKFNSFDNMVIYIIDSFKED